MLVSQLNDLVEFSLNMELYNNLVFYGERLLCEQPSDEVKFLLARGYIGEGKYHKAFQLLKETKTQQCRYLFAAICIKLNKFIEAERALLTDQFYSKGITAKEVENVIPYGACGYFLLGIILEKLSRKGEAFSAYKKSLELDPFMWCSYEKMCKINPQQVDPNKIYTELNPKVLMFNKKHMAPIQTKKTKDFSLSPDEDKYNDNESNSNLQQPLTVINENNKKVMMINKGSANNSNEMSKFKAFLDFNASGGFNMSGCQDQGLNQSMNNNGSAQLNGNVNLMDNNNMTPVVHKEMNYNQIPMKNNVNNPFVFSSSPNHIQLEFNSSTGGNNNNGQNGSNIINAPSFDTSTNIQPFNINISNSNISNQNANNSINYPNSNNIVNTSNAHYTPKTRYDQSQPIQPQVQAHQQPQQSQQKKLNIFNDIHLKDNSNEAKFDSISQLIKYYATIIKKINEYSCEEAITYLKQLPSCHRKHAWTNSMLGRCYFELSKYKDSEKYFNQALQSDPSRLEGMEYLSSCLWHLKDQFQCCNLAHRVLEQSQFSPETWIVLGNCFSLQKEHEIAIKFFTRATQINPSFAYAFTLCGHEYVDNENYAQARKCYSQALSCDDRHFNAWWGLGHIQTKEQNYTEAIKYFRKALSINEKSSILHFYLASAYLQNHDSNKALNYLLIAEKEDNDNAMIKYQISNILITKGKYDEALGILLKLDEKMPKEAAIHIMLGRLYQMKKDYAKALNHLNIAIDLDPKDSNFAKNTIETLYNEINEKMDIKKTSA